MNINKDTNQEAAYITIVEGPPPEFTATNKYWTASLAEGSGTTVARCEMRTMDGESLVDRCRQAWTEGRAAYLDYPQDPLTNPTASHRAEAEIVAASWEFVPEGQKLVLWVQTDDLDNLDGLELTDI